ncbi:MAG TPA: transcription elongation factor GreA [Candidatus Saccharimonadales bacterium]|nr:transcription elongation factor GreA [Candidatus Saccharimonadales bacterium]
MPSFPQLREVQLIDSQTPSAPDSQAPSALGLIRAVGLRADGPGVLGRPIRAPGRGVYIIELAAPLPRAPIDINVVGKWLERLPDMRLDREPTTSKAIAARLHGFWIPSQAVVFIGSSDTSIAARVAALERHVLGDRRPHAAGQWLKTLRVDSLRVWWASADAPEEYEDALLSSFAAGVPAEERAALHDPAVVLPFANLRAPSGGRKKTGIVGSVVAEPAAPTAPPKRVVDLPPGNAAGVPERKNAGTVRRTNATPPPTRARKIKYVPPSSSEPLKVRAAPRSAAQRAAAQRRGPEPVQLTADGLERITAELHELTTVRRPEVIARIRSARELGDLKENADYTAAREEQSFLEGRVQALEELLRQAVVVDAPTGTSRVALGSRVRSQFDGEELTFEIVGSSEADPAAGRISAASPVGRALVGRKVGDEAVVITPSGRENRYRVLAIE